MYHRTISKRKSQLSQNLRAFLFECCTKQVLSLSTILFLVVVLSFKLIPSHSQRSGIDQHSWLKAKTICKLLTTGKTSVLECRGGIRPKSCLLTPKTITERCLYHLKIYTHLNYLLGGDKKNNDYLFATLPVKSLHLKAILIIAGLTEQKA